MRATDERSATFNYKWLALREERAIENSTVKSHIAEGVSFTSRVGVLNV